MVDVATSGQAALKYPIEQDEKYKAQISFIAKGSSGSFGGAAYLYFPEAVSFSDGLVYDNANLGYVGEMVRRGAVETVNKISGSPNEQNLASQIGAQTSQLQQLVTSARDTLGGNGDVRNILQNGVVPVTSILLQGAADDLAPGLSGAVSAGTAVTANPHKRSVFRDVALRTFTFSFLMSPQSQVESQAIEDIVDFFRENAYPEKIAGDLGYKFPTKFYISFLYNSVQMSQAPRILPSYLTSVNTTLNPRSSSFFKDGKANEVQLTMSFQEERALTKEDIKGGY